MTRRKEKRESPVTISSESPSASAAISALEPCDLKGNTATQKPSARAALESVGGTVRESVSGFGAGLEAAARAGIWGAALCGACRARSRNSFDTSRAVRMRQRGPFAHQGLTMRAN